MFLKNHSSSSPFLVWRHRGIILTGLLIWLISLASTGVFSNSSRVRSSYCLHRLSPWFVTSDACVITTLNCTALNITGRQDEMNSVLDSMHLSSLSALIVDSCPEFETPTALVLARSLVTLIITNTTLMGWSLDAALTTENFPRLISFALSGSTMPPPPPSGLVGVAAWPDDLERIFVYETDIDELARSLKAQWSTITSFFCINCGLQTFPRAFFSMPEIETWVVFNSSIQHIPTIHTDNSFSSHVKLPVIWPSLQTLAWTYNLQLTTISDDVWRSAVSGSVLSISRSRGGAAMRQCATSRRATPHHPV